MVHYLYYWKPKTVLSHGDMEFTHIAGDQLRGVQVGDIVWIVTLIDHNLLLYLNFPVGEIVSRLEAEHRLGNTDLYDSKIHILSPDLNAVKSRLVNISAIALQLRFHGNQDRLPRGYTGQHLQSLCSLDDRSVVLLEKAWSLDPKKIIKPIRNPSWHRDELILALDLYFRLDRKIPDSTNPAVIMLSELLNTLPIHGDRPNPEKFRNPNGVKLKLANFRAIEKPGHGMPAGGKLDRKIWNEFVNNPAELRKIADAIEAGYRSNTYKSLGNEKDEDEEAFPEGCILYRLHRRRERNPKLKGKKKLQARRQTGRLTCEICFFDFEKRYGKLGEDFIECHHAVPISELEPDVKTKLGDIVLVCSNCHRMLHRKRPWLKVAELAALLA